MNGFPNDGFDDVFGSDVSSGQNKDITLDFDQGGTGGTLPPPRKYGLHWIQTLVVLLVTACVSYLLNLVLDIRYAADPFLNPRLVLNNALFFAILSAAILLTVFFLEAATSAMTPRFSRKPQLIVAAIAVILCALIGGLTEMFFVRIFVEPQIAPTPTPVVTATPPPTSTPTPTPTTAPTPTPAPRAETIIFALDKSYSMDGSRNDESIRALNIITQELTRDSTIGLIVFNGGIIDSIPLKENTPEHRLSIMTAASCEPEGTTDFPSVMEEAIYLVRSAALPANTRVKLVFITDGVGGNVDRYALSCQALNIQVFCVMIGYSSSENLEKVIQETKGKFVSVNDSKDILNAAVSVVIEPTAAPVVTSSPTPAPTPSPTPSPTPEPQIGNMLYTTPDSDLYVVVMFVLIGLVLGITLTLMLSLEGQFRFQLLLSPLMGLVAFLLIHYGLIPESAYWLAYLPFGIVLMRRNSAYFSSGAAPQGKAGLDPRNDPFAL